MQTNGVDITRISRFKNKDYKFAKRILSEDELFEFMREKSENQPLYLARAWAIKEAIFKADNTYAEFQKITLKKINKRWTFKDFKISISHEGDYLIAFVIR
ncbi:4'-phosphopantetheinyl transferase superfamily protein [Mycoplasmopsis sturni]|uniref:4'-phosphopantetheinyl transferase superfamily protein n=1 Tax=Mycoplasmopsis sturni TaxID=39047 RepID=UPI00056D0443|nr:4'-phosphopantetheinyl transferase superfamily protein [Mycoplasmopsis sturni]